MMGYFNLLPTLIIGLDARLNGLQVCLTISITIVITIISIIVNIVAIVTIEYILDVNTF